MIHVNRGDGTHEWLTSEEFRQRYPNAELNAPRPYAEKNRPLKEKRIVCDMSLRETAKLMGVTASHLSSIETGKIPAPTDIEQAYGNLRRREQ